MNEGLQNALIALSHFRHRHDLTPRFKNPRRKYNQMQYKSNRAIQMRLAREYIQAARDIGWRGSIRAACERGEHLK